MQIHCTVVSALKYGREQNGEVSEDAFTHTPEGEWPFIAVVADAHGQSSGVAADLAQYVANRLVELFVCDQPVATYSQMFLTVQTEIVSHFSQFLNGAVATCLIVEKGKIVIAQVGNCRVYAFDPVPLSGSTVLTQDHSVENVMERKRLQPFFDRGNFAMGYHGGKRRLYVKHKDGNLSNLSLLSTRGFGNPDFHPAFTYEPEVRTIPIDPNVPHMFALCTHASSEIVEKMFLWAKTIGISSLDGVSGIAGRKLPVEPKEDLTILLVEILPTS